MITGTDLTSTSHFRARAVSQLSAKQAFERGAGWRFGFFVGVIIVLFGYGWDALQLAAMSVEYFWIKFLIAALTILPLALLAGYLSGQLHVLLKLVVWIGFGLVSALLALHIPFEGARLVLQLFDPNLRVVAFLSIPPAATNSTGPAMTFGALLGIVVGALQAFVVGQAWDRSTDDHHITRVGWTFFLAVAPLALAYAALYDGTVHTPLRTPLQLMHSIIREGLTLPPDLDYRKMEIHQALRYITAASWRAKLTPRYIMRLAASEPSKVGQAYVDTTFDNGLNLRCETTTYGEFIGGCFDLNARYPEYLAQFLASGAVTCDHCSVSIRPRAADWQKQNRRARGGSDLFTIAHGAGSSVRVRVTPRDGVSFECLIAGADPVVIESCAAP